MPQRGTFCAAAGLALGASLALFAPAGHAHGSGNLCLLAFPGGARLAAYDVPEDGAFSLSFIHSVSRTRVVDTYRLADGEITQTSEIFLAHGAGLPSFSGEVGATGWRHEDGKFILDMNRPIGTMIVRVQADYRNTLHIDGAHVRLADWGDRALQFATCEVDR